MIIPYIFFLWCMILYSFANIFVTHIILKRIDYNIAERLTNNNKVHIVYNTKNPFCTQEEEEEKNKVNQPQDYYLKFSYSHLFFPFVFNNNDWQILFLIPITKKKEEEKKEYICWYEVYKIFDGLDTWTGYLLWLLLNIRYRLIDVVMIVVILWIITGLLYYLKYVFGENSVTVLKEKNN